VTGRRFAAGALAVSVLAAGCGPAGSGTLATRERDLPPFDRVFVSEGLDLEVELHPGAATSVSITYDDNLIDLIGTEVVDGELRIEIAEPFRVTGGGRFVTVVAADLVALSAESGADVRASGRIGELTVFASGGASLDLSLLEAGRIDVDATGGSFVAVLAVESVRGAASGGAEVVILGDPPSVDVSVSGGALVGRL
jgi:hypothetical protein